MIVFPFHPASPQRESPNSVTGPFIGEKRLEKDTSLAKGPKRQKCCLGLTEEPAQLGDEKTVHSDLPAPVARKATPVKYPEDLPISFSLVDKYFDRAVQREEATVRQTISEPVKYPEDLPISFSLVDKYFDRAVQREEATVRQTISECLIQLIPNLELHQYLKLHQCLFEENEIQQVIALKQQNFYDGDTMKQIVELLIKIKLNNRSNH